MKSFEKHIFIAKGVRLNLLRLFPFFLLLLAGCAQLVEPSKDVLYTVVDTWGKDSGSSSGPGHGDGTAGSEPCAFRSPLKVCVNTNNSPVFVLVLDSDNCRIQKFSTEGAPLQFADQSVCVANSLGKEGWETNEFLRPCDMKIDPQGRIFVCDSMNFNVQVFSPAGTFIKRLAILKGGVPVMTNAPGGYVRPAALAVDGLGRLYVADTGKSRIDRYTSLLALDAAWGVNGFVYDPSFSRIISLDVMDDELICLTPDGITKRDLTGEAADFWDFFGYAYRQIGDPLSLTAYEDEGRVFVSTGNAVKIYDAEGSWIGFFCGISGKKKGEVLRPAGVALWSDLLFLCDSGNNRIQVFRKKQD